MALRRAKQTSLATAGARMAAAANGTLPYFSGVAYSLQQRCWKRCDLLTRHNLDCVREQEWIVPWGIKDDQQAVKAGCFQAGDHNLPRVAAGIT